MLDIQPYVLRYWRTEFPALASRERAGSGEEYDVEDLEVIRLIKELLYEEGYTIASAKKKLSAEDGVRRRSRIATEELPREEDAREDDAGEEESPAVAGLSTDDGQTDDSRTEATEVEAPQTTRPLEMPSAAPDASGVGELGALTRKVERLEGGVAALVSQARQLASELRPETAAEDD